MTEPEWKLFRKLQIIALDRFCERVLMEIRQLSTDKTLSNHERYLAIFKLLHDRNDKLALAFDDLRRSTALQKLAVIHRYNLLTDEELADFRPETRETLRLFEKL